eukprot:CAMPEP_0117422072 /NCGR_PEP_ID=MMETSP0758-20121206/2985_1 /TAXON_ID=63605 /ORGANISM="Percolomonas cosmopolitus, Strain AE-1 (ATCC 50343)" /LENGTH=149 /DNA_ID=CAMNT_0005204473 /DNA_START=17 /DNA_END=463 /DNA_ORIENTATION=-
MVGTRSGNTTARSQVTSDYSNSKKPSTKEKLEIAKSLLNTQQQANKQMSKHLRETREELQEAQAELKALKQKPTNQHAYSKLLKQYKTAKQKLKHAEEALQTARHNPTANQQYALPNQKMIQEMKERIDTLENSENEAIERQFILQREN